MQDDHEEVLSIFTQQPFFQHILKLESERKQDTTKVDTSLDELAIYIQNVSFSLQSGGWNGVQVLKLISCLCTALRDVEKQNDTVAATQSVLLGMLTVIKANNTKLSNASRNIFLKHLKSFDEKNAGKVETYPDVMWPMSLRKVILTRSQNRPCADDAMVFGWMDEIQQDPWSEEWPVHVLFHDAIHLGCASVCTHDGVFVLIPFPKGQIWDAGLFVF